MGLERDFVLASRYLHQHLPGLLSNNGHEVILGCLEFLATVFESCRHEAIVRRPVLHQAAIACFPGFIGFLQADCDRLGVQMSQELFQLESQLDLGPFNANMLHFRVTGLFSFQSNSLFLGY